MLRRAWRTLAALLALLQACPAAGRQTVPAHPSAAVQKAKDAINRIPIGGKLTVRMIDGTEYHGRLEAIGAQTFSISEVDLKRRVTIPYGEVQRVRKNYGGKGVGGRRVDPRKSRIAFAVILGTFFAILFVALANDK